MVAVTASLGIGTVAATGRAGRVGAVGTGHGRAGEEKGSQGLGELHDCCCWMFLDVVK